MKVLVLFAHPALHKSRVNRMLIEGLDQIEDLTFHDLYEAYPDFDIDVEREQAQLEAHDVIIFQFPLFWYSTPSLLKEWQDLVLQHGWAYGRAGNALKGKPFFCCITAGGPQESYTVGGFHDHTLNQLLTPLKQTARLCKMTYLPPFVVHGSHRLDEDGIKAQQKELRSLMMDLTQGNFDPEASAKGAYMNDYLAQKTESHGG